jgi:uncharacterized heparinase superfamily protein
MAAAPNASWEGGPDHEAWLNLVGRTGASPNHSAMYRMRLSGPSPSGLRAMPQDPRPVDPVRGSEILKGVWRFGSTRVTVPVGRAPWGPPFPTPHFADRIHRFHWLRDVAAQGAAGEGLARSLVQSWAEMFGKWDAFAWRTSALADRMINLVSAGPWLWSGLETSPREALLESLARQSRHLLASAAEEPDPVARFRSGVALALAGAVLEDGHRQLEQGLALLEASCASQILADGGHASRSPEALADALLDIQSVEEVLLRMGQNAPAFLTRLQPRMSAMLSFFTLPGGRLLVANGGGDGGGRLAPAALKPYGGLEARFAFARLSGFQRIQAEDLTLFLDAGEGPPRPHGGRAHAGALAISVDDGPESLITSCGAHPDLDPALRDASRRTAAHSALSLNGDDSAVFTLDPDTGCRMPAGPQGIAARRLEEGEQYLLEGQHGAWRLRYGLVYRRRLYISRNGGRITGEDSLSRPMSETAPVAPGPAPFELRFHLNPSVMVAPGPDDRTLFLGLPKRKRVWRFRSEALISVETSRYWGGGTSQLAQQVVIRGQADPAGDGSQTPNRVRWALSRLDPAT